MADEIEKSARDVWLRLVPLRELAAQLNRDLESLAQRGSVQAVSTDERVLGIAQSQHSIVKQLDALLDQMEKIQGKW